MQKQKSLKFFVVICAILILDLPKITTAKRHHKEGGATTRGPAATQAPQPQPTQGANSDAAKLSYGNQDHHAPPPQAVAPPGWNTNQQSHAPPPYSQNPPPYQPQPSYHQPGAPAPQPVIINHVQQQPQSSGGGLGVGSGLAIGT